MNNVAKRLRQMLTMLLAVSMLAGAIPVNVFAAEAEESFVETQAAVEELLPEENANTNLQIVDETSENIIDSDKNQETDVKPGRDGESQTSDDNQESNANSGSGGGSQDLDANQGSGNSQIADTNQGSEDGSQESEDASQKTDGVTPGNNDEKQPCDENLGEDEKQSDDELPGSEENSEYDETETSQEEETEDLTQGEVSDNDIEEIIENTKKDSVSENSLESFTETILAGGTKEESGKEIPVTFSISGDFENVPLKIIQIIEDKDGNVEEYRELEGNVTTSVAGELFKFKLETMTGYKVTKVEIEPLELDADSEGVYSVKLNADSTIKVTVEKLKEFDVTFVYDSELVYGLTVKMDKKDVTLDEDNIAYGMAEDSVVSFVLNLDENAKVDEVTANGEKVEAIEGSVYTYALKPLEEAVTVNIETSLDPKKCNILDIYIWGHSDSVSIKCDDKKYGRENSRLLTKDTEERITIHVDPNYVVDQVLLNDNKETVTGTYAEFDVNFSNKRTQTLILYTTPKQSAEEKKIVFANQSSNITYVVNTKAPADTGKTIVKKDPLKQNTYTINSAETLMEFNVTHRDGYKAKVTFPDEVLYDVTSKGNTDTYSLAVATLGNAERPTEVIIEEVPEIRTISVVYDANCLSKLEAIENGKYIQGEEIYSPITKLTTLKYTYVHGTQIVLQIETTDDFILGEIKETLGGMVSKVNQDKKSSSYTINVNGDKTIELGVKGIYTTRVYDEQVDSLVELKAEKNVYTVEAGRKYKLLLYNGTDSQTVTKAVLKSGKTTLKDKPEIKDSENVYFEIPANQTGKTLTLETVCKEGTKEYTHKVQLKVLPAAKITKIAGVSSGKLSQIADTVKEYSITCNLPVNKTNFRAEIVTAVPDDQIWNEEERNRLNEEANSNFSAEIKDSTLKITVNTSDKDQKAVVKIYDASKSTENEKQYIAGGTFTITSKAPALVSAAPAVSLKNATNLDLILSLSMKGLGEIENGEYWYKVVGTPKYAKEPATEIVDNTESFVEYIKYKEATQIETIRVVDRKNGVMEEGDFPYKADYNIKVYLVQTKNKETPVEGEGGNVVFTSKVTKEVVMSTKVPAYETNLGIKTLKNTLYSGQQNVIVATPVFSKNTSYQSVTVEAMQEGIEASTDEDGNIMVSVGENVTPGKYTIEVTAYAAQNTLPAKKSFAINVVQGIYALTLETPKELYKQYNQPATFKAVLSYNNGDKVQPKTKKVEWGLQAYENGEWVDIVKDKNTGEEHPYYKMITIKDGKVTIDKSFIVSNDSDKNVFRVKVTAKDYEREEGQQLTRYSDSIEITNEKMTLGELVLVKQTDSESEYWEVIARSGSKVSIDKVEGSRLAILKKGTPERDKYIESDFVKVADELLIYSSNSKNLKINECTDDISYRTIETDGIASKVQFTVTTADGSNVKTALSNLTVTYADAGNLGVVVNQGAENTVMNSFIADTKIFYGAKDTVLQVKIQEQNEKGHGKQVYGANYTLKVQGAKIVESDQLKGEYSIVGSSENIVLQLTNNTRKVTKKFTLQNGALANQEVKKNRAITLKAEGSLKTGEFSEEQIITYALPKDSIGKYTHAYVTVDTLDSMDAKKAPYYESLIQASSGSIGNIQRIGSDGKIRISFKPAGEGETYLIPEENFTYKLNIAVGSMTDNYEFKADVKPNAVTIKTKKTAIASSKLTAVYNMSVKEGGEVILTLNNKKTSLVSVGVEENGAIDALRNRNISGRENRFAEFFEVVKGETEGTFILRLKPGKNVSDIGKNDWKGYINQYTYTDGTKKMTVYNTAIEVRAKDLIQKYSLTKAVVLSENIGTDPINTNVNLMAGKNVVNAKYVYVPQVKVSGKWKDQMFDVSVSDGALNLVSKTGVKIAASNTCTLYVVPEYSYYDEYLEPLWKAVEEQATEEAKAAYAKAMETYGIKLTATVQVKNKANTTGKIKFSSTNVKYGIEHFIPANEIDFIVDSGEIFNLDAEYTNGNYVLTVPYTKVVDWDVVSVKNESADSLVTVGKTQDEDSITLTLNKKALREKYKTDKKIYGKRISIKVEVGFGADLKPEKFTLNVTLPKQPVQLEAAKDSLNKVAWADLDVVYKKLNEDGMTYENEALSEAELISLNQHLIEEKINAVLGEDGDLVATFKKEDVEDKGTRADVPTQTKEGLITYVIGVRDLVTGNTRNCEAVIPLDKLLTPPSDLEEELNSAIAHWERTQLTNLNDPTEIISNVRKRVLTRNGDVIHKHLRLYAKNVVHKEATEKSTGVISGTFCIVNVVEHDVVSYEKNFEFIIPKLLTMDEAATAVKTAVEQIEVYNMDLSDSSKKQEKTDKIIQAAESVLKGQDYFVEVKRGSELMGTPANGDTLGSASIELNLINLTTERISTSITCNFEVLQKENSGN